MLRVLCLDINVIIASATDRPLYKMMVFVYNIEYKGLCYAYSRQDKEYCDKSSKKIWR